MFGLWDGTPLCFSSGDGATMRGWIGFTGGRMPNGWSTWGIGSFCFVSMKSYGGGFAEGSR